MHRIGDKKREEQMTGTALPGTTLQYSIYMQQTISGVCLVRCPCHALPTGSSSRSQVRKHALSASA